MSNLLFHKYQLSQLTHEIMQHLMHVSFPKLFHEAAPPEVDFEEKDRRKRELKSFHLKNLEDHDFSHGDRPDF